MTAKERKYFLFGAVGIEWFILANHTAHIIIGYWHHTVISLSVCPLNSKTEL